MTPVLAALGGTVSRATYQGAAGNYAVVDGSDGRSYVYVHMREPAIVQAGDDVAAGQPLGDVGETGRATGCHLHWYKGGTAIDPYDELREWEAG